MYQVVLQYVNGKSLIKLAQTNRKMHDVVFKKHKWQRLHARIKRQDDFDGLAQFMWTTCVEAVTEFRLTVFDTLKAFKCGLGPVTLPNVAKLKIVLMSITRGDVDVSALLSDCYVCSRM